MINYSLPTPIKGYVFERFLYDLDETKVGQIPATLVGISAYPGHALSLTVLLEDGSLFSYLPLTSFNTEYMDCDIEKLISFPLSDLVYHNCSSGVLSISVFDNIPKEVNVFIKDKKIWTSGQYIATLDWYEGNDLLHIVLLMNGQIAALPNHKLKFGNKSPKSFLPYRKLHQEWIV